MGAAAISALASSTTRCSSIIISRDGARSGTCGDAGTSSSIALFVIVITNLPRAARKLAIGRAPAPTVAGTASTSRSRRFIRRLDVSDGGSSAGSTYRTADWGI